MNRMKINLLSLSVLLVISCANPGVPSGGDKDETPPKVTQTYPENYTVDFQKKKVVIDFDEFVKLQDPSKNVVISPPQKKKPKVRLKEKRIVVDFRDSLRANTTYVIDFGKAIVDNNEGNPLGEYRYVFSTGSKIAEMGLAGYVKGAAVDTAAQAAKVALFLPSDTLNPYRKLPDYIAQTDSLGFFMFNNIEDNPYKIIAFQDANNNNMLDEEEALAFQTEEVHTSISETDDVDSLQLDKHTKFKNIDLSLRLFQPIPKQQYLKEHNRSLSEQLHFVFNAPNIDTVRMRLLDVSENPELIYEANENRDSLTYWIMNKNIREKDTLFAELSYLKTDSLGVLVPSLDTLKMIYKRPKRKKNQEAEEKVDSIEMMRINTNMSGDINYFDDLVLEFERPVEELSADDILISKQQDSLQIPQQFELKNDSISPYRKYHIVMPLEAASETYHLRIDSLRICDSGNRANERLKTSFQTYPISHYGKIFVTITDGDEDVLLQCIDKQSSEIVAQQEWKEGKQFAFENLPPSTYILKVLWDVNHNGKWDTGNYDEQLQPEKSQVFKKEIKLLSNWELPVSWTLKKR